GQPRRRRLAQQLRGPAAGPVLTHRPPAPLAFQQVLIPPPGIHGVQLTGPEPGPQLAVPVMAAPPSPPPRPPTRPACACPGAPGPAPYLAGSPAPPLSPGLCTRPRP